MMVTKGTIIHSGNAQQSFIRCVQILFLLIMIGLFFVNPGISYGNGNKEKSIDCSCPQYWSLKAALGNSGLDLNAEFTEKILRFLNNRAAALIGFLPSRHGLSWYFTDPVFLREDLILVNFEDGDQHGGELLIKLIFNKTDKSISAKTLWCSSKKCEIK